MCAATLLLFGILVTMVRTAGPGWGLAPFTVDARRFLNAPPIPRGAGVLIDDDITYVDTYSEFDVIFRVRRHLTLCHAALPFGRTPQRIVPPSWNASSTTQ